MSFFDEEKGNFHVNLLCSNKYVQKIERELLNRDDYELEALNDYYG